MGRAGGFGDIPLARSPFAASLPINAQTALPIADKSRHAYLFPTAPRPWRAPVQVDL